MLAIRCQRADMLPCRERASFARAIYSARYAICNIRHFDAAMLLIYVAECLSLCFRYMLLYADAVAIDAIHASLRY